MLVLESPTKLRLNDFQGDLNELTKLLTFHDKKAEYELQRFKNATWYANKFGQEAWTEKINELKSKRVKHLVFEDSQGIWTYSGLVNLITKTFPQPVSITYKFPTVSPLVWRNDPKYPPRYYQSEAARELIKYRHAAVEIATGGGKSFLIALLIKELGLQTIVMTPSTNIAEQIYNEFIFLFGNEKVGRFFDSKKEYNKLITVATAQSLTRIAEDSKGWNALSKTKCIIGDEGHMTPAATLEKVCMGLCGSAPYRFFLSGTQMRNDGLDLSLAGIIGPIVYDLDVRACVDQGFLAKPFFRMFKVPSNSQYDSKDPLRMIKVHLYQNENVIKAAAEIANKCVYVLNRPTLIAIDEFEQFQMLLPHLRCDFRFAHGGVTDANRKFVPEKYHKSDPSQLVKEFNEGKFPLIIGTSCVSIGTDFQNLKAIINLVGGKSEIQVKQLVGRGTRKVKGKEDFFFIDFDIYNKPSLHRHALARKEIYKDIYGDVKELTYAE
jgi:superfamily II DNA or RNA helicase